MGRGRQVKLNPHPVSLFANDSAPEGSFLAVADDHNVERLGIEAAVVCSRAIRDPALDDEVAAELVGVITQVIARPGHAQTLPPAWPGPNRV
jgi:hypothetical protein